MGQLWRMSVMMIGLAWLCLLTGSDASAAPPPEACSATPPQATAELLDPALRAKAKGPREYTVVLHTTRGDIHLEVTRDWAPKGADRFYYLVKDGYYTDIAWFRVVPGFVVQGGMHGNPAVQRVWSNAKIPDDPVRESNVRGTVTFATSGPNSRTNQIFINYDDNSRLDGMGFAPFATVVKGMDVVDGLYSGYGQSPNQGMITAQGSAYLCAKFPRLDRIISAEILEQK